jgi:hypothetical protein
MTNTAKRNQEKSRRVSLCIQQILLGLTHFSYLDSDIKSRNDGCRSNDGNYPNDDGLGFGLLGLCQFCVEPSKALHTSRDLKGAKSEIGTNSSGGRDQRKRVDNVTPESPCVFSEERIKRGAKGHRQTKTVGSKTLRKGHKNNVTSPGSQTPVMQGLVNGILVNFILGAIFLVGNVGVALMKLSRWQDSYQPITLFRCFKKEATLKGLVSKSAGCSSVSMARISINPDLTHSRK